MISTDNNLKNPTSMLDIELHEMRRIFYVPEVESVSREHYNALKCKDEKVYVINEYPHEIYYKDSLISKGLLSDLSSKPEYYIKFDKNTCEYLIIIDKPNLHYTSYKDAMSVLERHKEPSAAINALQRYNRIGYPGNLSICIYNTILYFMEGIIPLNKAILGIISNFGFKSSPEFQMLIDRTVSWKLDKINIHTFEEIIKEMKKGNILFKKYTEIYEVFRKNKFFKNHTRVKEQLYIDSEIEEILKIML